MKRIITLFFSLSLVCLAACDKETPAGQTGKPYVRLSSSEKTVPTKASSFDIYVTSNIDWKVEAKSAWLSVDKAGGKGNMTVKVSYEASSVEKRTGAIRFTAEGLNPVDMVITQTDLTFTNPIFDMPDPWVVKHGDYYYPCKASGNGINLGRSTKLSSWGATSSVWKAPSDSGGGAVKPWNTSNIWAPELHRVDGVWYIYYTAGRPTTETNGSYTSQRSGVLRNTSDDPTKGTWEDMGMLYTGDDYKEGIVATTDNTIYAIDLAVFYMGEQLYAVWSGSTSKTSAQNDRLYIATMSNPYTISSSRVEISRVELNWEKINGSVNEGPAFLLSPDKTKFYVVYSANGAWTKQYRLGYLKLNVGDDPMKKSSWTKSSTDIFYRCDETASQNGVNGVGHCCFTKSPDETEDWIVYHTKNRNDNTWSSGRSTFIQKFKWNEDGTPNFGKPVGWGDPVVLPSGETR